jgi:transposase
MENASRAFLDSVRKSMRQIRETLGAARVNPKLLTAAERLQYEGYLRREQTNAGIMALAKDGVTIKEIVRRTGHSRGLVRQVLRGQVTTPFGQGKVRWSPILNGSTRNGLPAGGMALSYGGD